MSSKHAFWTAASFTACGAVWMLNAVMSGNPLMLVLGLTFITVAAWHWNVWLGK